MCVWVCMGESERERVINISFFTATPFSSWDFQTCLNQTCLTSAPVKANVICVVFVVFVTILERAKGLILHIFPITSGNVTYFATTLRPSDHNWIGVTMFRTSDEMTILFPPWCSFKKLASRLGYHCRLQRRRMRGRGPGTRERDGARQWEREREGVRVWEREGEKGSTKRKAWCQQHERESKQQP